MSRRSGCRAHRRLSCRMAPTIPHKSLSLPRSRLPISGDRLYGRARYGFCTWTTSRACELVERDLCGRSSTSAAAARVHAGAGQSVLEAVPSHTVIIWATADPRRLPPAPLNNLLARTSKSSIPLVEDSKSLRQYSIQSENKTELVSGEVASNIAFHSAIAAAMFREPPYRPRERLPCRASIAGLRDVTGRTRLLDLGCGTGFIIGIAGPLTRWRGSTPRPDNQAGGRPSFAPADRSGQEEQ